MSPLGLAVWKVNDRAVNPEWICAGYSITSSARETRRGDAERLLGLEVDHQLGLRRLLNGQVHPY
jgi:hypothetical protein